MKITRGVSYSSIKGVQYITPLIGMYDFHAKNQHLMLSRLLVKGKKKYNVTRKCIPIYVIIIYLASISQQKFGSECFKITRKFGINVFSVPYAWWHIQQVQLLNQIIGWTPAKCLVHNNVIGVIDRIFRRPLILRLFAAFVI